MQLPLLDFTAQVQQFAAAAQAACASALNFATGGVIRAIGEASTSVGLWIQWLIVQVLLVTRAATSTGADLDSFMADFGVARLGAVAATGNATFARYSPTAAALVPIGALAKTLDGTQTFAVIVDTTNAYYVSALTGYVIPAGVASIAVPVQAVTAGAAGNIQAGTLTLLSSAIPGVDTVSNAAAFTNGADAETDAAARARFQAFFAALRQGTVPAITFAVQSIQQGLFVLVQENSPANGFITVIVDDGSGNPPAALLAAAAAALPGVRAAGTVVSVQPPTLVPVNISLTLTVAAGVNKALLLAPVSQAVTAWVNALTVGATLPYSRIAQLAYGVDPGITNVSGVTLDGGTVDLVPATPGTVYRINAVVVA